ncbi:MAG: hypothetical protein FWD24_07990 [Treponema sp.]|nr:hypothetical protein [Treponema sp.]
MKKFILIILPVLIFISCLGPNSRSSAEKPSPFGFTPFNMSLSQQEEGSYFLLVKDERTVSLNTYENGKITEQKTFNVPEKPIVGTNQKNLFVIIDASNNTIIIYDIHTSKETKLSIPYDIKPKNILINDENIFIGGMIGKELLVQYHFKNEEWYQLEIPEEVTLWGKAIDDLVINDNFLIAIDNIVMPKYILFYHLNSTGKLVYSHHRLLKYNGTYEYIYKGRISSKYLGLLSSTVSGYTGVSEHITIYSDLDLKNSFTISSKVGRISNYQTLYDYMAITDFQIVGDKLYIANRRNGLGILEIKESYFRENLNSYRRFNHNIDANNINYIQYVNEEVLRLTLIPNESKMILTIRNTSGLIRHEIIEL